MGADDADPGGRDILAKSIADHLRVEVIQSGRWFVEQQHLGMFDQGTGDRRALLLPPRERGRPSIREIFQAKEREPGLGAFDALLRRESSKTARHLEIARNRGEREQIELLKDETELAPLVVTIHRIRTERSADLA